MFKDKILQLGTLHMSGLLPNYYPSVSHSQMSWAGQWKHRASQAWE